MNLEVVGKAVLDGAFKVHSALGPGLLESACEACLAHELNQVGIVCQRQVVLPIEYDGIRLDEGYRVDLLVASSVVVEIKSVKELNAVHMAQVLSYLKMGSFPLGYLINFNVRSLRDGIRRVVHSAALDQSAK